VVEWKTVRTQDAGEDLPIGSDSMVSLAERRKSSETIQGDMKKMKKCL